VNDRLQRIENKFLHVVSEYLLNGQTLTSAELKAKLFDLDAEAAPKPRPKVSEAVLLADIMQGYLEHLKGARSRSGKLTSPNTMKTYNNARNALLEYQEHQGAKIHATDIDRYFHRAYLEYMEGKGCKASYASKIMDCAKAALKWAHDEGTPVHEDVINGKLPKIQPARWKRATISPDELRQLMALDLRCKLEKTRDLLVIGCWTALRVSDLMKLGDVKVQTDQDGEYIQVASTKIAGTYIEVPLHPHVQAIRDRWQGWPPAISDQRFNDYVKELCKLAGMNEKMHGELAKVITKDGKRTKRNVAGKYAKWELISSHTCRRSFATNFYGVLPTGDIMHVTGHSSEAQLMEYIHAKPIDTRRRVRAAMDTL
jgi:integrase